MKITRDNRNSLCNGLRRTVINKVVILKLEIQRQIYYVKAYVVEDRKPAIILVKEQFSKTAIINNCKNKELYESELENLEIQKKQTVTIVNNQNRRYNETIVYGGSKQFIRIGNIVNKLKKITENSQNSGKIKESEVSNNSAGKVLSVEEKSDTENKSSRKDIYREIEKFSNRNKANNNNRKNQTVNEKVGKPDIAEDQIEEGEDKDNSSRIVSLEVIAEGASVAAEGISTREVASQSTVEEERAKRADGEIEKAQKVETREKVKIIETENTNGYKMYTREQIRELVRAREHAREREIELRNKVVERAGKLNRLKDEKLRSEARIRSMQDILDRTM